MKTSRWLSTVLGLTAFALFIGPGAVFAEDFTFNIPIELRNLPPELNKWILQASVADQYGRPIGRGELIFNTSGPYVKTVQIKFNANPGKLPADAVKWQAILFAILSDGSYCAPPDVKCLPAGLQDPNSPAVHFVFGGIPKQ